MNPAAGPLEPITLGLVAARLGADPSGQMVRALLGVGTLVGPPPDNGGFGWSFRTLPPDREQPSMLSALGLGEDMLAWPLRHRPERRSLADVLTVGRASSNDLVMAHAAVSKLHARVHLEATGPRLEDVGSANGSEVNARAVVPGGTRLVDGDLVTVGPVRLRFYETERLIGRLLRRA